MSEPHNRGGAIGGQSAPIADNTMTLVANGQILTGWTDIEVTRGIERMPSSCRIAMTERYPGQAADIVVKPGDPCRVMIGSDLVITGYVDRYLISVGPTAHTVGVEVRGKCEDLVDCSAGIYPPQAVQVAQAKGYSERGMVMTKSSLLDLARELASPFGIEVNSLTGDNIPLFGPTSNAPVQFNIIVTETPIEIIERAARYAAVLAYEGTDGSLLLAKVGTTKQASGFEQGVNVQAASASFTLDQRYSIYLPLLSSVSTQTYDFGIGAVPLGAVLDPAVTRFRPLIVVSEQPQYGVSIAALRAAWEMSRRRGRSQSVRVTVDSWRDVSGGLWAPNSLASVNLPMLKILAKQWLIAEVTFVRNLDRGTVADLMLMPPEAFTTEPSTLQLYDWQVDEALRGGARAGGAAP